MMQYKGYAAKVEFDDEAGVFHGEVTGTRDVITFQGVSVRELRKAFAESVDDYLAFCAERGETPDKPFSGQFVARLSPELHRKIFLAAKASKQTLNAWVTEQLSAVVEARQEEQPAGQSAPARRPAHGRRLIQRRRAAP